MGLGYIPETPCHLCKVPPTLRISPTLVCSTFVEYLHYTCRLCGATSGKCITEPEASEAWNDQPITT